MGRGCPVVAADSTLGRAGVHRRADQDRSVETRDDVTVRAPDNRRQGRTGPGEPQELAAFIAEPVSVRKIAGAAAVLVGYALVLIWGEPLDAPVL